MAHPTQTILVTGSNSGFGRLIVETLARQGHVVFAGMRESTGKNAAAVAAGAMGAARGHPGSATYPPVQLLAGDLLGRRGCSHRRRSGIGHVAAHLSSIPRS